MNAREKAILRLIAASFDEHAQAAFATATRAVGGESGTYERCSGQSTAWTEAAAHLRAFADGRARLPTSMATLDAATKDERRARHGERR